MGAFLPAEQQRYRTDLRRIDRRHAAYRRGGGAELRQWLVEPVRKPDDYIVHAGANKAAILADTARAAERALATDPTIAKAYQVQAWLAVGLGGDGKSGSSLPRFHNFAEWEKLAEKSISVRPSDCGC